MNRNTTVPRLILSMASAFFALLGPPLAAGPAKTDPSGWEYKAVAFDNNDEKGTPRKLNDLAADGWEYVGPLGNGLVAFRRSRAAQEPGEIRSFQGHTEGVITVAVAPDGRWAVSGPEIGGGS